MGSHYERVNLSPEQRKKFISKASQKYPFSEQAIGHSSSLWSWEDLSENEALSWSEELIARFEDRWGWRRLSENEALPWSKELIARFEDQWSWRKLSENEALPWDEELIDRYEDRWSWRELSGNEDLPWSKELISRYENRWSSNGIGSSIGLSGNEALPWTEDVIKQSRDWWDWKELSANEALPRSEGLIAQYMDQWDWENLSTNEALPWSEELIARFEDRWQWTDRRGADALSGNGALPWDKELISRYRDQWDWRILSGNEALPWSEALIERFKDEWSWRELSGNESLPWSEELIERFEDRWVWLVRGTLSQNEALPWSEALIEQYEDQWDWEGLGLSGNEALPWSTELIERFKERWSWGALSENEALPWSEELIERFAERWNWEEIAGSTRIIKHLTLQDIQQIANDPKPPDPINSRVEVWKLTATEAKPVDKFPPRRVGKSEVIDSQVTEPARDRISQLSAEAEEAHFLLLVVQYNERFEGKFADFLQRETRYELWKDGDRYFADAFDPPRREGCYYRLLCYPEGPSELPSGEVLQKSDASEIFHGRSERPLGDVQWERDDRSDGGLLSSGEEALGGKPSKEEPSHPDEVTGALGEGSVGIRTYTHIRGHQLEFCRLELYIDGTEHWVLSEGNEY
ncbi:MULTISPECIES: hypothetical protein [Salinibacter]|uniref:Uncharacterized protein n=1 Tax=Salinibacter ruber TaxID=146919 RepID=A0A9X2V7F9_9BACT|nr:MULTISPECIES: hypothetical protein [Salinibacter]MCS3698500.1 hypothetical protein [Salinibacter ruber]MCS4122670.1 hypothetical protein [Salinibacter ruber]MCS4136253.1 hypothetical protein [Salinibacter ruber]